MRELVDTYVDVYGRRYISDGTLDYAVQGLEKLIVWTVRPVLPESPSQRDDDPRTPADLM